MANAFARLLALLCMAFFWLPPMPTKRFRLLPIRFWNPACSALRPNCVAWFAKTRPLPIRTPSWPSTCASRCVRLLQKGQTDQQILDYMTARYGDFVLYRPPFKSTTMLLWVGPGVMLVAGLIMLVLILRRRSRMPAEKFDAEPDEEAAGTPQ